MPKFNWKRLFMLSGLTLLSILLVRGCVIACGAKEIIHEAEQIQSPPGISSQPLKLYLHREKKNASIGLEEYLVGVVAAEMPASFNVEALKAQSVAARTYSLRRMSIGGCSSGADICSNSECCQAYRTDEQLRQSWGASYEANLEKVKGAVMATAGEALYYDGDFIEALYHSASGGMTEDSENVFSSARPYLRSVSSEYEVGVSGITDEVRLTKKELARKINKAWPKAKVSAGKLSSQIKIKETYESGRVKTLAIGSVSVTGREFRGALELRSAMFTIDYEGDDVIISTKGYGHGVGMSQTGANGMAQLGMGYNEILAHYYTGAQIIKK